jgi:periplasmic protein TonB
MKQRIAFLLVFIFQIVTINVFSQTAATDSTITFVEVEEHPEYPGGYEAMMNFVRRNQKYPRAAKRAGVQGEVRVTFVVDKSGSIVDVKTVKSLHPDCDAEAERIVKSMPQWSAGKLNGKPVDVRFSIPIKFKL